MIFDVTSKRKPFGTDSERMAGSLWMLDQVDDGGRLPDLLTNEGLGNYTPRIGMEVKSGKGRNGGKLVGDQIVYGITNEEQYKDFFGVDPPRNLIDSITGTNFFLDNPYEFFYNIIVRTDDLGNEDLTEDFSAIKMTWGDQYLVPGNVARAFITAKMVKKDIKKDHKMKNSIELTGYESITHIDALELAKGYMQRTTLDRLVSDSSLPKLRKSRAFGGFPELQNLELPYLQMLHGVRPKKEKIQPYQKEVMDLVLHQIPDLGDYKKKIVEGPFDSKIHIMVPKDLETLIDQMESSISQRKEIINEIANERRDAIPILTKITNYRRKKGTGKNLEKESLFVNGGEPIQIKPTRRGLDPRTGRNQKTLDLLYRLANWKSAEDIAEENDHYLPDYIEVPVVKVEDGVPF